ncbi:hypothetical protein SLINC_7672 [Streptomyces lincolnensis]|uniref:Uncharacterized protein n=1 Tax=Streptomyces lincolnensis TaxID=1915 RepID=A0A1B1MMR6_STRLN|nr:hypothetical protein [Streptomyces lincolnensis]ANS69896.1 hypothetical protein SLINC_7672 [Streptomyces lincolnensis]AXG58814.1 hypothetical protein SLCG_7659 [Streptomyces lincolnensis]QMV11432.1 hypothetical protein GJU35_40970 [Streptomyces lincolnensis]
MAAHRSEGPGENGAPIPRDLPDQQAHDGEDPWEVGDGRAQGDTVDSTEAADTTAAERAGDSEPEGTEDADADVPDTDESGTGRRGAPRSGAVHEEHPVPDEPSA